MQEQERVGKGSGRGDGREGEWRVRKSKDKKFNKKGKVLLKFIEEKGWSIFNGIVKGDKKGNIHT